MDPALLWARAFLLASIACFLGVAGHVTADGLLPGPGWLALLVAVGAALCVPLLSRPASALRLVVLLVGGQTLVHLFLTVTAGHVGDPIRATAHPVGRALPTVDGRRVGSLQDQYEAAVGTAHAQPALPVGHLVEDVSAHAPMMAVHLLAAVLVGLWLAVGERALWTLLALATAVVLRQLTLHSPGPPGPRPRARAGRAAGPAGVGPHGALRRTTRATGSPRCRLTAARTHHPTRRAFGPGRVTLRSRGDR